MPCLGAFGRLLGLYWDPLEAYWIPLTQRPLEGRRAVQESLRAVWARLEAVRERSWAVLNLSWGHLAYLNFHSSRVLMQTSREFPPWPADTTSTPEFHPGAQRAKSELVRASFAPEAIKNAHGA